MGMFEELRAAYSIYANVVNISGLYADTFQDEIIQKFGKYLNALKALDSFYRRNGSLLPEPPKSADGRRFLKDLTTVGDVAVNTQLGNLPKDEAANLLGAKDTAENSLFAGAMLFYDDAAKVMKEKRGGFDAEDLKCLSAVGELYDAFGFEKTGNTPIQGTSITPKQQYAASEKNRGQVVANLQKNQKKLPKDTRTEKERHEAFCEQLFEDYGVYQQRNRELEDRLEREKKERQALEEQRRRNLEAEQRKRDEEEQNETRRKAEKEQELAEQRKRNEEKEKSKLKLEEERKREEERKNLPLRTDILYEIVYQGRDVNTQLRMQNVPDAERREVGQRLYRMFTAAWDAIKRITAQLTGGKAELLNDTMRQIDDYVQNKTEQEPSAFEANRKLNKGMSEFLGETPPELLYENEDDFRALKQMNEFITFNSEPGKQLDENKAWYDKEKDAARKKNGEAPAAGPQQTGEQTDEKTGNAENRENGEEGYSFIDDGTGDGRYSDVEDILSGQIEPMDEPGGKSSGIADGDEEKEDVNQNAEKQEEQEKGGEDQNVEKQEELEKGGEDRNVEKQDGAEPDKERSDSRADEDEINTDKKAAEPPAGDPLLAETDGQGAPKTAAQYAADLRAYLEKIPREERFAQLKREMLDNQALLQGRARTAAVDFGEQMPMTALLTKLMIAEQNLRVGEEMDDAEREFRETLPIAQLHLDAQLEPTLRGSMSEEFLAVVSPDDSPLYAAAADMEPGGLMKAIDWAMNGDPYRALGRLVDGGMDNEDRQNEVEKRFRVLGNIHTLLTNSAYNGEVRKPMLGASDPAGNEYENVCKEIGKLAAPYNESGKGKTITLGRDAVQSAKKTMAAYLQKNAASTAPHLRERFDRVMCAYACLCRKDEIRKFCDGINRVRVERGLLSPDAKASDVNCAAPQDYDASRFVDYNEPRKTAKQLVAKANAMGGKDKLKLAAMKYAVFALSVKEGRLDPHALLSERELNAATGKLLGDKEFCAAVDKKPDELLRAARVALDPSLKPKTRVETKKVNVSRLMDVKLYLKKLDEETEPELARLNKASDLDSRQRLADLSEHALVKAAAARWMASREFCGSLGEVDPKRIDCYADYLLNHYRMKPNGVEMDTKKMGALLNAVTTQNEQDRNRFFDEMEPRMAAYANNQGLTQSNTADVVEETRTITTGAELIQPTFGL